VDIVNHKTQTAFVCTNCGGIYWITVTACDCKDGQNRFYKAEVNVLPDVVEHDSRAARAWGKLNVKYDKRNQRLMPFSKND
jgi:hypothetical protein